MGKGEYTIMAVFAAIGAVFAIVAIEVESTTAKWIWGLLATAVIIFTIYATIEGIVKSKRKPKDIADLLISYMEQESKKPGFKDDFAKRMEAGLNRRNALFEGQRPDDDDYGYSFNNPIMTSTISYSDKYLSNLRTADGQKFTWSRNGSHCVSEISGVENVMVDEYQLYLNGNPFKIVYICPYGHSGSFVPKGLKLSEQECSSEKATQERSISVEQPSDLRKALEENARLKKAEEDKIKEIEGHSTDIKARYPAFDFNREMQNPLFAKLVRAHIDVQTVYEIIHKEQLLEKKMTEVVIDQNSDYYMSENYYYILCNSDPWLMKLSEKAKSSEEELKIQAEEKGITVEQLKMIEQAGEEAKSKLQALYLKQSKNAERVKYEYPQFNLEKEIANADFSRLIKMGFDMQIVYEIIHIDELFDRKVH